MKARGVEERSAKRCRGEDRKEVWRRGADGCTGKRHNAGLSIECDLRARAWLAVEGALGIAICAPLLGDAAAELYHFVAGAARMHAPSRLVGQGSARSLETRFNLPVDSPR